MDNVILFVPISKELIDRASSHSRMFATPMGGSLPTHDNLNDMNGVKNTIRTEFETNGINKDQTYTSVPYAQSHSIRNIRDIHDSGEHIESSSGSGSSGSHHQTILFSDLGRKGTDLGDEHPEFTNVCVQLKRCNEQMEWPPHTPTYCYNCCHSFETRPWFLPVEYQDGVFIVEYNFCSPSCTMRYNYESKHHEFRKRQSLLCLMIQLIYKRFVPIKMALQKDILNVFGGNMSIDLYRKHTAYDSNPTHDVTIEYPPIYSIIPLVCMKKHIHKEHKSMKYALYRDKPLVRTQMSILEAI